MSVNSDVPQESEGKRLIDLLKSILFLNDNHERFFPEEKDKRIRDNFSLFDRDNDLHINLDEVKELLNSIDVALEERDIELIYNEIKEENGITIDNFYLFLTKKIKDDDKETELIQCFRLMDKEGTGMIKDIDNFKDIFMSKGNKWNEEQVDELLEALNPKGGEVFTYAEFCRMVTKKEEGKGKKKKKKKKKA